MKWAVAEKFREYLLGTKLTIYTDNNPLAYRKSTKVDATGLEPWFRLTLM